MSSRVFVHVVAAMLLNALWAQAALAGASVPAGYASAARAHNIPTDIFYAVALTESGKIVDRFRTRRPWPWTLNVGGKGYFYASREDAHRALRRFLAQGKRSIDIGLMQVNWRWHRDKLGDAWRALDPDHNLQVGARILATCYRERRDRWDAVGCYHAPNNPTFASRYRKNVAAHWRRIARRG
ncbi:MAG: lytic transglycosylase domain-containing protein [Pseudomonadota bacterium]|nr:lytic transglycosylase domain-containing protein [Pseudomonadota bacterium]